MSNLAPSVLIVEDDDSTREVIGNILRDGGFSICCEATAAAALSRIRRKRFDLVVADINLPGTMNGLGMMQKARQRRPELRCLFTSGWHQPIVCNPQIDEFIAKPFRPSELVGCVWKVLAGNSPNPRVSVAKPH
ncbi:MAG TPA: response regulator [Stellaceae bacterium]|nr:response regulator [Stellaceae bacterium]